MEYRQRFGSAILYFSRNLENRTRILHRLGGLYEHAASVPHEVSSYLGKIGPQREQRIADTLCVFSPLVGITVFIGGMYISQYGFSNSDVTPVGEAAVSLCLGMFGSYWPLSFHSSRREKKMQKKIDVENDAKINEGMKSLFDSSSRMGNDTPT